MFIINTILCALQQRAHIAFTQSNYTCSIMLLSSAVNLLDNHCLIFNPPFKLRMQMSCYAILNHLINCYHSSHTSFVSSNSNMVISAWIQRLSQMRSAVWICIKSHRYLVAKNKMKEESKSKRLKFRCNVSRCPPFFFIFKITLSSRIFAQ